MQKPDSFKMLHPYQQRDIDSIFDCLQADAPAKILYQLPPPVGNEQGNLLTGKFMEKELEAVE